MDIYDSNEAEVLAILEALRCFSRSFQGDLIMESDSSNGIACVSNQKSFPWKLQSIFNEIRVVSTNIINVVFQHKEIPWKILILGYRSLMEYGLFIGWIVEFRSIDQVVRLTIKQDY